MDEEIFTVDEINEAALNYFKIKYVFPYQRLVVHNVLCACGFYGDDAQEEVVKKQIVILPTGAGKSLCFMLPGAMIEQPVLMIFPLLSLMSDQARRIEEAGHTCGVLKGGQSVEERQKIYQGLKEGSIRFLIANPEVLLVTQVRKELKEILFSHLVIDEAHTVSEWGDTFREAYLQLGEIISYLRFQILTAFTATASTEILNRMKEIVFHQEEVNLIYGDPDRTNLFYSVIQTDCKREALGELVQRVEKPLLIFARSRSRVRKLSVYLRRLLSSQEVFFYHAGLSKEEKKEREQWFFHSDKGILTATCAYGLGVDKQNIRTVIHYDPPPTVEAYLQEAGRGGRDRKRADAYLLFSKEDEMWGEKIENSLLRRRYKSVLNYAKGHSCRRQYLIAQLNRENDYCSGCDVCENRVENFFYLKGFKNPYRFLSRILKPTEFQKTLTGGDFPYSHQIFWGKIPIEKKNSEVVLDYIDILYKRGKIYEKDFLISAFKSIYRKCRRR